MTTAPPPRRITRDEIDWALMRNNLRIRAENGSIMATAALTGIPPDELYAEVQLLNKFQETQR